MSLVINNGSKSLTKPKSKTMGKSKKTGKTKKGKGKKRAGVKKQPFKHRDYSNLLYENANNVDSSTTRYVAGNTLRFYLNKLTQPYYGQIVADPLPQGYDQYEIAFSYYKVHGAYIELEISPNTSGKQVTLLLSTGNSVSTLSLSGQTEQSVGGLQRVWEYPLPTDKPFKFKKFVSIAAIEALKKAQFEGDIGFYMGQMISSAATLNSVGPIRKIDFQFAIINNTDTTAVSLPYHLKIYYYSEFTDRKRLPQSYTPV